MPDHFFHGYALLIGVGLCACDPWSLPVTVRDMQALRAILANPALCGSPADHIRLLHDDGATRQAILDGLADPPNRGRPRRHRGRLPLRPRLAGGGQAQGLPHWPQLKGQSLSPPVSASSKARGRR